jgi:hypothetical protein
VRPGDESAVLAVRFSEPVLVTVRLRRGPLSAFVDTALHHVSARPPEGLPRVLDAARERHGSSALRGPGVDLPLRALLEAGAEVHGAESLGYCALCAIATAAERGRLDAAGGWC